MDCNETLEVLLPDSFSTKIISCKEEDLGFEAVVRTSINTKDEAMQWLQEFSARTLCTFRVRRTFGENTNKIIFKKRFRCVHKTPDFKGKNIRQNLQNTGCKASILLTVKQSYLKRSIDKHLKDYPTEIRIRHTHNHQLNLMEMLKFRPPSKELETKFRELFYKGHSPTAALELYKIELQQKHPDFHMKLFDGSICPKRDWCFKFYNKVFQTNYSEQDSIDVAVSLDSLIADYNNQCKSTCAQISSNGNHAVIALCTPLMKSIHKYVSSAAEVMLFDSSENLMRRNSKIYLLQCANPAGALPLGLIIGNSDSKEILSKGLKLLKALLSENSFFNKGYPKVILTSASLAERDSLELAFPKSNLVLYQFHVLQALMRFIWSNKNGIDPTDRSYIYNSIRNLAKLGQIDEFENGFWLAFNDVTFTKYDKLISYLNELKMRSREWALCYRSSESNFKQFDEADFRMLADRILRYTRNFSMAHMFNFCVTTSENYYKRKLDNAIANRFDAYTKMNCVSDDTRTTKMECERLTQYLFLVLIDNLDKEYIVNVELDFCSCPHGLYGDICNHQFFVNQNYCLASNSGIPAADLLLLSKPILHNILSDDDNTDSNITLNFGDYTSTINHVFNYNICLDEDNEEDFYDIPVSSDIGTVIDDLDIETEMEDLYIENGVSNEFNTVVDSNKNVEGFQMYPDQRIPETVCNNVKDYLSNFRSDDSVDHLIVNPDINYIQSNEAVTPEVTTVHSDFEHLDETLELDEEIEIVCENLKTRFELLAVSKPADLSRCLKAFSARLNSLHAESDFLNAIEKFGNSWEFTPIIIKEGCAENMSLLVPQQKPFECKILNNYISKPTNVMASKRRAIDDHTYAIPKCTKLE